MKAAAQTVKSTRASKKAKPAARAVATQTKAKVVPVPAAKREERNGIKRPLATGGKCAAVWKWLDSQVAKGKNPTRKDALAHAEKRGWNLGNTSIEFYQWCKFNA